jgi:hypothetical protein
MAFLSSNGIGFVSFSGGTACVDGSCLFGGSGIWQGDLTAGLVVSS